jgi:D-glycero-alpha-D-manno-heptose-7-phosphate kinase
MCKDSCIRNAKASPGSEVRLDLDALKHGTFRLHSISSTSWRKTVHMVITRTPLRISFFGGGTDYPVWYRENGGAVLATTIDKNCYITCRRLPPFFEYHSRVSYSKVENVGSNQAIEHPSVRACLQFLGIDEGVEIHHVADLPARTGLGTSSAFTVGLLLGLYALQDRMRDKHALAADAIHVEQNLIGEAVGTQDQVSAAHGGFNRINFHVDGTIEVKRMLAPAGRLAELEQHLALFFTGFSRTASEIAQEQIRMTPVKKQELHTMFHLVDEAEAIVNDPRRSLDEFGHLLHESWQIKRSLTQKITNANIDEIYEAGLSAGALGGKLLGAGGGGFMLFFVRPEQREALRMRLKKLLCVPFSFSNKGSHVVVYEPEEAYDKSLIADRNFVYA